MAEAAPPVETGTGATDTATARSIRFAVYLTGGFVALAFGVNEFAASLGGVLNCLAQTLDCPGGFTGPLYLDYVPVLGGAGLMVGIGAGLLFLARRHR